MKYWWKVKNLLQHWSFRLRLARKYGLRVIFSQQFYKKSHRKYRRFIDRDRQKRVYGSGFLSSRKHIKARLMERDGCMCNACQKLMPLIELTIDHIIQRSRGGSNNMWNLQLLCVPCHKIKDSPVKKVEPFQNKPFKPFFENYLE